MSGKFPIAGRVMLTLLGMVVAIFSALVIYGIARSGLATDFKVFWAAAHSPAPYAPRDWPFSYPPTMLLWLSPLKLLPLNPAFALWSALSAMLYVAAVRPMVGRWWPYALLAYPGAFCLVTGQVSLIVASLVFFAFQCRWTGLLLGLALTIKPQLVFLAPLALILLRDRRQLAWLMGTALTIALLATLALGVHSWFDWFGSLGHFQQRAAQIGVLRAAASPATVASWAGLNLLPFLAAGLALALATLVLSFRQSEQKGPLLMMCCILGSPYALTYDLVAVMPLAIPHLIKASWRTIPAAFVATSVWETMGLVALASWELGGRNRKARVGIIPGNAVGNPDLA